MGHSVYKFKRAQLLTPSGYGSLGFRLPDAIGDAVANLGDIVVAAMAMEVSL